jgi:phage shock protein C
MSRGAKVQCRRFATSRAATSVTVHRADLSHPAQTPLVLPRHDIRPFNRRREPAHNVTISTGGRCHRRANDMRTDVQTPLERSTDRVIAGVCGGLAHHFDVDPVIIRLAFVVAGIAGGAGILAYVVLWIVMPPAGFAATSGSTFATGVRTMATEVAGIGREVHDSFTGPAGAAPPPPPPAPSSAGAAPGWASTPYVSRRTHRSTPFLGLLLVVLGIWLLLGNLGVLDWASARYVWPGVLVVLGLALLLRRRR